MTTPPLIPGFKTQQNALKEQIERIKIQRLQIKRDMELEGLNTDRIQFQKSLVGTQVAMEGLKGERIKLGTSQIQNQISLNSQGKLIDQLEHDRVDRLLTQQQLSANLELKAIQVGALFEQVRHERVLNGSPVEMPKPLDKGEK